MVFKFQMDFKPSFNSLWSTTLKSLNPKYSEAYFNSFVLTLPSPSPSPDDKQSKKRLYLYFKSKILGIKNLFKIKYVEI